MKTSDTINRENTSIWPVNNIAHTHNTASKRQPTRAERFDKFSFTIIQATVSSIFYKATVLLIQAYLISSADEQLTFYT